MRAKASERFAVPAVLSVGIERNAAAAGGHQPAAWDLGSRDRIRSGSQPLKLQRDYGRGRDSRSGRVQRLRRRIEVDLRDLAAVERRCQNVAGAAEQLLQIAELFISLLRTDILNNRAIRYSRLRLSDARSVFAVQTFGGNRFVERKRQECSSAR